MISSTTEPIELYFVEKLHIGGCVELLLGYLLLSSLLYSYKYTLDARGESAKPKNLKNSIEFILFLFGLDLCLVCDLN